MEKQEQLVPSPRRNILRMALASMLTDIGFAKTDKQCLETLTEVKFNKKVILINFINIFFHSFIYLPFFRCFKAVSPKSLIFSFLLNTC